MRKAAKVSGVEYYRYLRSLQSLDRAHVAIVVIDATVGFGELDVQIAIEATRRGCATVLAVNKCDIADPDLDEVRGHRLAQAASEAAGARRVGARASPACGASRDGRGAGELAILPTFRRRLSTAPWLRSRPSAPCRPKGGRRLKTYFITQYETAPPRFAIDVNSRTLVTRDFGFFVENRLRAAFDLAGVPLIIDFKEK